MQKLLLPLSALILVSFSLNQLVFSESLDLKTFQAVAKDDKKGDKDSKSKRSSTEVANPGTVNVQTPAVSIPNTSVPVVQFDPPNASESNQSSKKEDKPPKEQPRSATPGQGGHGRDSRITEVIAQAQETIVTPVIQKPTEGERVKGKVKIEVQAPEAYSVEFSIQTSAGPANAFFLGVANSDSGKFSFDWDTSNTPNWSFILIAKANYNFRQSLFAKNINIIVDNHVPEEPKKIEQINKTLTRLGLPPAGTVVMPITPTKHKSEFSITGKCGSSDACKNFCEKAENIGECVRHARTFCEKAENKDECKQYLDNFLESKGKSSLSSATSPVSPSPTTKASPSPSPTRPPTPQVSPPPVGREASPSASPSSALPDTQTPTGSPSDQSQPRDSTAQPKTQTPVSEVGVVALPSVPNVEVVANSSTQLGFSPAKVSVDTEIKVEKIENVTKDNKTALLLKGKATPNSIVTIYILSNPIVVTVRSDANGTWTYTLDKPLVAGEHEVFVTVAKPDGALVRSEVSSFAIAKAAGTSQEEGLVLVADSGNKFQVFITYTAGLIVLAVAVLLAIFFLRKPAVVEDVVD